MAESGLQQCSAFLVVGDGDAERGGGRGLDRGIGRRDRSGDIAETGDHRLHVVDGELGRRFDAEQVLESSFALDGFGHPLADLGCGDWLVA